MKEKIKHYFLIIIRFLFNPHFIICFGMAWIVTNGWSYICLAIGTYFEINWMIAVAGCYMTFLWFPFTPEKIITVIIAIELLKRLFPNDEKTLAVLKRLKEKYKSKKEK